MPRRKASQEKSSPFDKDRFAAAEKKYAVAMKLFVEKKDWSKAKDAFSSILEEFAEDSGIAEFTDRARLHLLTCERKLSGPAATPSTGADWLLEAVVLSNDGQTEPALSAFEKALAGGAEETKVYYARAAAMARAERSEEAVEDLRRAIEADPEVRAFALGDPDFERVRELATFVALVEPPSAAGAEDQEDSTHGSQIEQDTKLEF